MPEINASAKMMIDINAKIEQALIKIKPAKKRGQFGIYEDYVDDFIVATIKNCPLIDLGFVDRLSHVIVKPKNRRQAMASDVKSSVSANNVFYVDSYDGDYNIYDRVQMFGKTNNIELPYENANVILPESVKEHVKFQKGKLTIDYEKLTPEQIKVVADNLKNDHLDKMSDKNYAKLFEYMEKSFEQQTEQTPSTIIVDNKSLLKSKSKEIEDKKKTEKVFFHELNHAVCLKQFTPIDENAKLLIDKTSEDIKSFIKEYPAFYTFYGGMQMYKYEQNDEGSYGLKATRVDTKYLHEGITEQLANEQMNVLYPGEFDYKNIYYSYFPLVLYSKCIDTLCDKLMTKAYYRGEDVIWNNEKLGVYNKIMQASSEANVIIGNLYGGQIAEKDEKKKFDKMLTSVVRTQNVIWGLAVQEFRKGNISDYQANDILCMLNELTTARVWDGVFDYFGDEQAMDSRKRFYPVVKKVFDLEMDRYQKAQAEEHYDKFVANRIEFAQKHADALIEEADNVLKQEEEQRKQIKQIKIKYGVGMKNGKKINGAMIDAEDLPKKDTTQKM